jgi:hypothetical protein
MCDSNYEKVLINSGIGEYKHSDFLGEPVIIPTKSLAKKVSGWTEQQCHEYAKSCIEGVLPTLTSEEREDYGRIARFVESVSISEFIESASDGYFEEEMYFRKAVQEEVESSLYNLGLLVSPSEKEEILKKCKRDNKVYFKFRLASQAIRECELTISSDNRVTRLSEMNAPRVISEDASIRAIERRKGYHQNIKKIFRKKGAKQFIIDNVINVKDNGSPMGAEIRSLLSDSLASSDDIMNSGRVVDGSAFSGKKNK